VALKNVTITLTEEAARWARRKAAEENTSVSKLVGQMLEEEMRRTDAYWQAFERIKRMKPISGLDAAHRLSREETHDRHR
jgi:SHS2 domain-containing protein